MKEEAGRDLFRTPQPVSGDSESSANSLDLLTALISSLYLLSNLSEKISLFINYFKSMGSGVSPIVFKKKMK